MARLRRADNVVGARVQRLAHALELRGGAVGELLWCEVFALGGALHFLAVLVHAGDEQHIKTVEPLPARERVDGDALIGVADMGRAIRVRNGGGDHISGALRHAPGLPWFRGAGKRSFSRRGERRAPGFEFALKGKSSMSGAGRGKPQPGYCRVQRRGRVTLEKPLGSGAVKANETNARMRFEKRREIVRSDAQGLDIRVEAAGAPRAGANIPQRDAALREAAQPFVVRQFGAGAEQPPHQRPKRVAWLRVILPGGQRRLSRQRTEDQNARIGARDGWKADRGICRQAPTPAPPAQAARKFQAPALFCRN